jgi:Delta24-sterol reductase
MDRHKEALTRISRRVQWFYERKQPFRIYHGSTNSTRQPQYTRENVIDTSPLSNIIKVDEQTKTALVEPNVPMDRLVQETIKHGLIPPIVMEFPGITVGGGFAGTSGESSSHKYGLFNNIFNWIEIVLADGKIMIASNSEEPDLFRGSAGSFGTLGVITLLEIQLIRSKQYVELTYCPVSSVTQAISRIEEATEDKDNQYVDGIMFGTDDGVIMSGRLTDLLRTDVKVQRFARARDPWFYLHAHRLVRKGSDPVTVVIPIVDYLFRYDRGGFWVGAYAFKYFVTPFNRITRWALDVFMHTRVMLHALHESGLAQEYIVQDISVPYENAASFVNHIEESLGLYPLWFCPVRRDHDNAVLPITFPTLGHSANMMLNIGIWGPGPKEPLEFVRKNRELERKALELHGFKCLYARAYYTEEEFWTIYDRQRYTLLRDKYNASTLPTIYDKVKPDPLPTKDSSMTWLFWLYNTFWGLWPLTGLWGVFRVITRSDYLFVR